MAVKIAEMSLQVIMGAVLCLCGIQDIQKKKINIWPIIVGGVIILLCIPLCNSHTIPDRIGGIAVGALVIMISIATGGKIGMGDGMLLCLTGLGLGLWGNLELFAIALLMAAGVSIVLLVLGKTNRKKSIPFVPFLMISYVIMIALIR